MNNSHDNGGGGGDGGVGGFQQQQQPYPYGLSFQSNASVAIIIVVLGATFFFMFLFLVYIKRCSDGGRNGGPGGVRGGARGGAWGRQSAVHGLDPEILHKFPIMSYGSVKRDQPRGRGESAECAVCLGQFEEAEKLRLLPACGHSFHPECIDLWLETHSTCPLCRRSLDVPPPPPPPVAQSPLPLPPPPPPPQPSDETTTTDDGSSHRDGIIRALSRNSESFKSAAHDAELREVREKILMRTVSGRSGTAAAGSTSSSPRTKCLSTTPRPPRHPGLSYHGGNRLREVVISMVPLASGMHHSHSCSELPQHPPKMELPGDGEQGSSRSDRWESYTP